MDETQDELIVTLENDGNSFTREGIKRSLVFDSFSSTKFLKLPHRGMLGNALKVICGAPIALAEKFGRPRPVTLLMIKSASVSCEAKAPCNIEHDSPILRFYKGQSRSTKITLTIPHQAYGRSGDKYEYYPPVTYAQTFLIPWYSIFNPWVNLTLSTSDGKVHYRGTGSSLTYRGLSSIHWYSLEEFRRFVKETADSIKDYGDLQITDLLSKFRGLTSDENQSRVLKSLTGRTLSLSALALDDSNIDRLYNQMKRETKAPRPELLGSIGKENLCTALKRLFGDNLTGEVHYQHIRNIASKHDYEIPYSIEVAVAKLEGSTFYQCYGVNNSPILLCNPCDPKRDDPFQGVKWEWQPKGRKAGSADSFEDFLLQVGHLKKGEGAILVIHITCPNLSAANYAKSKFDVTPLASDLTQQLYEACKRYYRAEYGKRGKSQARLRLIDELDIRKQILEDNQNVMPEDKWTTQQALYYLIRMQMGGKIDIKNRKTFFKALREECTRLGGDPSYREKLGIIAAERAQFFHRGREEPVSFDRIKDLSDKGSDLLLIEKEAVSLVLERYARKRGIALINTRGFAVDYAKDIAKIAEQKKSNVFMLTDWDASGLLIATKLPDPPFHRIGVDGKLLTKLGLTRDTVEENYTPHQNHLKPLPLEKQNEVRNTRVEIDAVLAKVGPDALWKVIEEIINETSPERDLTRSLSQDIGAKISPDYIAEPLDRIRNAVIKMGRPFLHKALIPLQNWRGLTNIEDLEQQIEHTVTSELSQNSKLKEVGSLLKKAADILGAE